MILLPEYMLMPDGSVRKEMALSLDNDAVITEVFSCRSNEKKDIHCLSGLLIPGLINSHCHLELSWCQNLYPKHAGIENFYSAMSGIHTKRPPETVMLTTIQNIIEEQHKQGIVAIADISNTDITLIPKIRSNILFHTFLEVFGTNPIEANYKFGDILKIQHIFREKNQRCSLSAHTLFTLSSTLMSLLMTTKERDSEVHFVHFMESREEKQYFGNKTPIRNIHKLDEVITTPYHSAADAACHLLPAKNRIMFVHNTFAEKEDIQKLKNHFTDPWFCFCPASNQFITEQLPDVPMIMDQTRNILVGTDSLSSNHELNLFAEMDILLKEFPSLTPESLLMATTLNGARFLNIEDQFGSFEINKKPGIVLLENYQPGIRELCSLKVKRLA